MGATSFVEVKISKAGSMAWHGSFSRSHKTCKEIVNKTNFHTVVSFFQPKCMVYACFVAKMSKMAFTRFGGQFQFEKSMLGRLDNSGAGYMY